MLIPLFLLGAPGLFVFVDFVALLFRGRRVMPPWSMLLAEVVSLIILPFLYANFGKGNVCCADETSTAAFAPAHQLTIGVIILLALGSYAYSKYRKRIAPPLLEALVNIFLFTGVVLSIFVSFHTTEAILGLLGGVPVLLLGVMMLMKNHSLFVGQAADVANRPLNRFEAIAWKILQAAPIVKFPLLFVCCLPVLVLLTVILLLFGQKPDSMIRAFTDTYHHNFSQLNYECNNVDCGGHYLCSVAANGHQIIVQPQRLGTRHNKPIICNRQLLVANAFEELIQERMPRLHRFIRHRYNRVGDFIHRYYTVFSIKAVSDLVYLLMKPLEWFFLLVLYAFDRQPENRIARQYLTATEKAAIQKSLVQQRIQ